MESLPLWILGLALLILVIYDIIMIPIFVKKDEESKKEIEGVKGLRNVILTKYKVL
jgi:hypothetical protein